VTVRLSHDLPLPAAEAFSLVADPRTHGSWVPVTRVEPGTADWSPAVDATFAVVSGPGARRGRPGFVDRMRITTWQPPTTHRPGLAEYRKLGPILLGTAGFEVSPTSPSSCRVVWWEDVYVTDVLPRGLTRPFADVVLTAMVRLAWRRLDDVVATR
jgi:hypothetical protein